MATFYSLVGVTTPFDPSNRFTTSSILPSIALAILRLLLSLYSFVTIFFIYAWQCTHGEARMARRSFSFFTDLTYYGLAFYFFFAGLHTLSYALKGKSWLNGWPKPLQAAHTIFYTTIVCFPPLVTIVFWAILYNDPWFPVQEQAWSNVSQHGLNSLYALLEIFLTRTTPPPPLHLAFLIFILALYLSLAYLSHATQGFYPYNFLDPATGSGKVAGYCFAILAGICVIFGIVWCLISFRGWSSRRLGLDNERRGRKSGTTLGEPEQELHVVEMKSNFS